VISLITSDGEEKEQVDMGSVYEIKKEDLHQLLINYL
jgi:hypothetical protein